MTMKIEMLGLRRKILATCACGAIAVAPCGRAQTSANQLCAAAGLGSGCIGAVKLSGMSRRGMSGPGSVSPSGLLGGLFTTVILSIVDDAVTSSPVVASASGTATSLSSDMSARASTLRANMDARPRLLAPAALHLPMVSDTPADKIALGITENDVPLGSQLIHFWHSDAERRANNAKT
jgi:hypothetical protein